MTFAGVDVMQNKETGKYYFLEVNMQPQLTTGALLKEKQALLVDFFSGLQK
jgi:D-alanine-D-alanine ligase-like ATP-grasp enzyme